MTQWIFHLRIARKPLLASKHCACSSKAVGPEIAPLLFTPLKPTDFLGSGGDGEEVLITSLQISNQFCHPPNGSLGALYLTTDRGFAPQSSQYTRVDRNKKQRRSDR